MPKYFDIHSHINFPDYDADREEVLKRLTDTETWAITVGTDPETSASAVKLAEENEGVFACIGVHPADDSSASWEVDKFNKLISSSKVVAVGECGLDFFHRDKAQDYKRQEELFLKHIEFALKHNKPIMIHSRSAYSELLDILEPLAKEHGEKLRGDVHFFAGDIDVARRFLDINFTLSFTGVITFKHDYDEVIKFTPLEMIMSETDAPYVAPVPHRGQRNEPSYVCKVVEAVAKIREEDFEHVRATLVSNALRMIR